MFEKKIKKANNTIAQSATASLCSCACGRATSAQGERERGRESPHGIEITNDNDEDDAHNIIKMGLLFAKIWSLFGNEEHKLVMVGLDNAGKTTILYQFLMNEVVHTSPTIGSNVEEIVWKNIHFLVWDLGGQQSLRAAWSTYYTNTEFIIMVIDSTDRERLAVTREELYKMLQHEDLTKASLLVYANKQDLKDSMSAAEISKQLDLTSIKNHQWHIQSCCALTGEGLYQGLEWIAQRIKKK